MPLRTSCNVRSLESHLLNSCMDSENTDKRQNPDALDDLSFWSLLKNDDQDALQKLYPPLPDGYFDGKGDIFEKEKNIFEKYRDAKVKPYFTTRDFGRKVGEDGKSRPVVGYEIGIKISF